MAILLQCDGFETYEQFEMSKSTTHGLIKKTAQLFDILEETLKEAILENNYPHMDESYYTVLEKGPKSATGKSSYKVYVRNRFISFMRVVQGQERY